MNLDFVKMCGKHNAIFEAYYKQIDPKGAGTIEAMTAAKFLKKSGLSDVVLSRIWDLSDPNGKGFLDKPGFFVALKLVSLAQSGQVINMNNIYMETANPPKVGDLPKIIPSRIQTAPVSGPVSMPTVGDWSISIPDRQKYEKLFESLHPVGGMLAGNKVKGVLMESKLPMDTLGKIWDLADQDKDGNLDKHEFLVAMHLVYQTLEKRIVPDVLPMELRKLPPGGGGVPPQKPPPPAAINASVPRAPSGEGFSDSGFVANFPKDIAPPPAITPLPVNAIPPMTRVPPVGGIAQPLIPTDPPLIPIGAPPSVTANADWVVTPTDLKRFEIIFRDSDRDKDGLVSGLEVKNVFLQSGVPQKCLAHIWALCDTNGSGKLTLEQFALAMWLVERKQKGLEPPQEVMANMVPPSMRGMISGVDLQPQAEPKPTYSNPELEMISKEIEELAKERRALETEIAQKEADIRIKSGEVRSLQSEHDTLSATLKQLENQRGEAQKRLDDLKTQVNKLRDQRQKQEETINEQEGELNAKRSELQKLKDEEAALHKEYDENNKELQRLTQHLQNTQLQISSVRSMVTQLLETQRQMTDALLMCRAAIENQDGELVTEYQLKIEPDFDDARKTLEKKIEEPKADPFEAANTNNKTTTNGFTTNGFSGSDAFAPTSHTSTINRSGFDDNFSVTSGFDSGFDAFGGTSSGFGGQQQKDPFGGDAFGANKPMSAITPEPNKDDFGSDPFAALHAPTGQGQVLSPNTQKSGPPPRPESPSPALPPKKSKVPPPRPAPPRPQQGPPRPTQPTTMDAFGSASTSGGGFADFADFDNKITTLSTQQRTQSMLPGAQQLLSSNSLFDSIQMKPIPLSLPTLSITATTTTTSSTSSSSSLSSTLALDSIATTSITTTTTTTTTTMSTIESNHLKRSTTPLQQATNAFGSTLFESNKLKTSKTPTINGPTDFSDDPFKDYRYEDPFSIKDPFDDDDDDTVDPDKLFQTDLGSDDETNKKIDNSKNTSVLTTDTFATANSQTSAEFLDDSFDPFADLTKNRISPALSHKSSTSGGTNKNSSNNDKSQGNTPIPTNVAGLFEQFRDLDAFSTKSSSSNADEFINKNNNNTMNQSYGGSTNKSPQHIDVFFDAFNDNFEKNSKLNKTKTDTSIFDAFGDNNNKEESDDPFGGGHTTAINVKHTKDNFDAFDAFGTASASASSSSSNKMNNHIVGNAKTVNTPNAIFDDFNDTNAFEDDFFKTKKTTTNIKNAFETTNKNKNNNNNNSNSNKQNISKFDDFGKDFDEDDFTTSFNNATNLTASSTKNTTMKLSNVYTKNSLTKIKIDNNENLAEKFAADYSKPETFDADLQEALKRSMLDN